MLGAQRFGLMGKQPPEAIVERSLEVSGAGRRTESEENAASVAMHLAFGAATGAIYGVAASRLDSRASVLGGVAFGLGIWTVSYKGWVPAIGALPHADVDRPSRVRTMVGAHVVFGAALGWTVARLRD